MQLRVLRAVAWLKLVLTVRYYRQNLGNTAAYAIAWLVLLGFSVGGGVFLYAYCHMGGPAARDTAMAWALWLIALVWVSAPLLQFDAQRNLDLSGLRLAPLHARTFTGAVLIDAVVSPLGLFLLPVIVAGLAAFTLRLADLPWIVLALAVLWAGIVGAGQALYLFANQVLMSRRFADASMVIGILIFALIQGFNIYAQSSDDFAAPGWLAQATTTLQALFAPLVDWLLPGVLSRAAAAASAGAWQFAGPLYLLGAVQAAALVWLAGVAGRKYYDGEIESGGRVGRGERFGGASAGFTGGAARVLLQRERLYAWRDPVLKMIAFQTLITVLYISVMIVVMGLRSMGTTESLREFYTPFALFGMALLICSMESGLLFNRFGYEGGNFIATLVSPVPRPAILRTKSQFYLRYLLPVNVALVLILAATLRAQLLHIVAAVLVVLTNTFVIDLIGAFMSIYFPFTYRRRGRRVRAVMAQPGCGYLFVYSLVWQASNLAVLPGSAAIIGGTLLLGIPGLALGTLVAAGLAWAAHVMGQPHAALLLEQREMQLLAVLTKPPE